MLYMLVWNAIDDIRGHRWRIRNRQLLHVLSMIHPRHFLFIAVPDGLVASFAAVGYSAEDARKET